MTRGGSAAAPPPVIPRSLRAIDKGDLVIMTESIPPLAQTWFKRQPPHDDVPCTEVTVTIRRKAPFPGPCHRRVLDPPATHRASTLTKPQPDVEELLVQRLRRSPLHAHIERRPRDRTIAIAPALPPSRNLMSTSGRSPGERDCRVDTGICWGALRPRAPSAQPYDRHYEQVTPGHHWYMSRRLGSETGLRPGILRWTPTLRAQMR